MTNFITHSCPSCGGQLEITPQVNRFACAYCGTEHLVKRDEGIVFLEPVLKAIFTLLPGQAAG